jgi:hypothetical protein
MPPARFEPAIPAGERLQTHALDLSATGIGPLTVTEGLKKKLKGFFTVRSMKIFVCVFRAKAKNRAELLGIITVDWT